MRIKYQLLLLLFLVHVTPTVVAQSAEEVEQYWPCVQRYIDTLYPDVYWPEAATFTEDARLVDALIVESAMIVVDEYASLDARQQAISSVKENYQDDSMALLFLASLNILNDERRRYLRSILKREKGQAQMALNLEESFNTLDQIEASEQALSEDELSDLKNKIEWQQRIFQERNNQIISLCELPVEVEERLSALAKQLREAH